MQLSTVHLVVALVTYTMAAPEPQFITFHDGKLGVNFGGYHAAVGLGGAAGSGGAGGLFAEAGTPNGPAAHAGLGGLYGSNGGASGGLYAGATAGGNVRANAGIGGAVGTEKAAGSGFASAQAGNHEASSGLGGEKSGAGSAGFKFSSTKSYGIPTTVEVENNKIHKEFKVDADNEVRPVSLSPAEGGANIAVDAKVDVKANVQPAVLVKEVYVEPQPQYVEKHIIHTQYKKPHRHHVHKTAYIGGYVGGAANVPPYTYVQPAIQKRVDVGVQGSAGGEGFVETEAHGQGGIGGQTTITKEVTVGKNPNFFQDIFNASHNLTEIVGDDIATTIKATHRIGTASQEQLPEHTIPISTLQAVGKFLSNSAADTKISVQKSATVEAGAGAESDSLSPKHDSLSSSSSSSSEAQISVQTPSVSKIIDNIFAIPISTLGAVNKFLENNVSARKRIQVTQDGSGEHSRTRLGPHARRRANKHVVIVQQDNTDLPSAEGTN